MNEPQARYRIGIDVGGTFTDLVAVDRNGTTTLAKTPSTPADQSVGVLDGLGRLAAGLDTDLADLLSRTERIVHGATVATNAILERKGAKVGLLTTEGHRDVIEMREGLKPDRYNMSLPPPEPLVPRRRRLGVAERLRPDGTVERPLDKASLDAAVARLKEQGVGSVAVCFLHAWRDGAHERAAGEAVRAAMPDAYISLSSEVLPQIKEFERVSTTVVNAYVGPALELYLGNLVRRLEEAGYAGQLLVILSHGGVAPVGEAVRLAAGTVLSGPAGGVSGARYAAELLGMRDLIPFDMGGTSTDISLISEGRAALSSDRGIAGERIALSSLDIATIGAGGGSIAHVDAGGVLHVGPRSAGADPGPACYGRGGADATVTDASLVLGFLDPGNFLGGRESLDAEAAEAALGRLARHPRGGRREGRRGGPPRRAHQYGRGDPPRFRAPGRRPEAVRPALLRRCRRHPHHRCRAPARHRPGDRAARGLRPLRLGHAGHRPPLRGGAHPHRGCRPPRRRRAPERLPPTGGRGAEPARPVPRRRGPGRPRRRHAVRRADIRD